MTDKQLNFISLPAYLKAAVGVCISLIATVGMVTTVAAQAEPTFTMPLPDITLVPGEPKVIVGPEVISVTQTCSSAVNIISEQRNTLARVTGTVESSSCPAASHGEYTFVIAIRDENDQRSTLEFTETWQRNDDAPISFMKEYPIGENVDLTRVSLRGLRCSCDDLPAE
jgi:hypothetical protein